MSFTLIKSEGAGKARRRLTPAARLRKKCRRQVPQVQPRTPGLPCATVLTLIRSLPGAPGLLATIRDNACALRGTPASGCQHAATSRPHHAVRRRVRRHAAAQVRPSLPASRVVTIARNAPPAEAGCAHQSTISEFRKVDSARRAVCARHICGESCLDPPGAEAGPIALVELGRTARRSTYTPAMRARTAQRNEPRDRPLLLRCIISRILQMSCTPFHEGR